MKINGSTDLSAGLTSTAKSTGKNSGTKAAASNEGSAPVRLSDLSARLHALDASGGDFDSGKVDNIKQAIRDGKFHVNSEAVADKLISSAQELLSKTQ